MSQVAWRLFAAAGVVWASAVSAQAQAPANFQHIVFIVQENRTPDDLFYALCAAHACNAVGDNKTYDIQTSNWLDKHSKSGVTQPLPIALANDYKVKHSHGDFLAMCDLDPDSHACRMDGAGDVNCTPRKQCPDKAQFRYVDNSDGTLDPYLALAAQYGWANQMYQTNQGPSFPAHQYLFGATSAPSKTDDHRGTFAAENLSDPINGCIADPASRIQLIDANGVEDPDNKIFPCFEHRTIGDLLDRVNVSWRYYTPGAGDLWSAPDAIAHICKPVSGTCTGAEWRKHLDLDPADALRDIGKCKLSGVSWIIPTAANSDHAGTNDGGGPSWVASIVNAIGNSPCANPDGSSYWNSTAIVLTWDDWGGWYDHEKPTFLGYPQGGYQYGFRVPLIFISAYTPAGYINNNLQEFGSVARFVEYNYAIPEGALTFADARTTRNLHQFYDLTAAPRAYKTIPAKKDANFFLHDTRPLEAPDEE
jgi:phospholipase C